MSDNAKNTLMSRIKGFFILQKFWMDKYLRLLLVSIIIGVLSAFFMVLFRLLLILFEFYFSFIPFIIAPLIAGLGTSLLVKFGKLEKIMGTGATEFVEDLHIADDNERLGYKKKQIGLNVLGKTLATSWTFGSGMVCGLEGPGLLIGKNLGHLIFKSEKFQLERGDSLFIGASACTAAILRTPISGALFVAELPYNNHIRYNALIASIISSGISYLIFSIFFGFDPLISILTFHSPDIISFIMLLPILGIFGLIAGIFVLSTISFLKNAMKKIQLLFSKYNKFWILPFLGSCIYSVFFIIIIPFLNRGYSVILIHPDATTVQNILDQIQSNLIYWLFLIINLFFFIILIFLSIGTFNSAGIIMPLLVLGALFGGVFGILLYPQNPILFVLLGMSAILGASTNNPITAILIIVEMTWLPVLFLPASIVTIIAYVISGPNSIIEGQIFI
jgi:CIC family chloride channel protein